MARSPSPAQPFIARKTKTYHVNLDSSALHAYYYQLEQRNLPVPLSLMQRLPGRRRLQGRAVSYSLRPIESVARETCL
jgi:hypothetical protein